MDKRKKLYNVSLLRMFSTILIIAFHILLSLSPGQGKQFFPFYMGVPIFLFISGYLYASKEITNVKNFYKSGILKILLPTTVFVLLYMIILGIIALSNGVSIFGLTYDVSGGGVSLNSLGNLWFIPAIILCYLLLPLLNKLYNKELNGWQTALCLLLFILAELGCNALCTCAVLPFSIGFFAQKLKQKYPNKRLLAILLSIVAFCFLATAYPFVFKIAASNTNAPYLLEIAREFIVALIGVSFSIIFLFSLENIKLPAWAEKFLRYFDHLSFPIYFVHHVVIFGALSLMRTTKIVSVDVMIVFVVTLAFSALFDLMMKYIWKIFKNKE